ncbi:unnamed protein product [Schistosoma margrebowiei]|uniref:Uncharacterized protein n=1 Tax=Schistosoma margrebowiei TaxID=48269 RepID=A0A183LTF5_9TREM|nr:unnamed protein product [Schistosoma margrebowiei]
MLVKNGQFRRVSKSSSIYSSLNSNNNNNTILNVTRHYSPQQSTIMNTINKTTLSHHLQRHLNELNTLNKRENPLDHSISLKSNDVLPHHFINNKLKVHSIRKFNYEPKIHDEIELTMLMFVLKIVTLILVESCFDFHMFFTCRNVALALPILAFTFASDPPCSSMMFPSYVKDSTSSRVSPSRMIGLLFLLLPSVDSVRLETCCSKLSC